MKDTNDQDPKLPLPDKVREAIGRLKSDEINLYRIFVEQTRQLHSDVWNGVRFFLTVNAIIIAAMAALYGRIDYTSDALWFEMGLAIIGILLTLVGMFILSRHRDYYLEGLKRKIILEYSLGLYEDIMPDMDLVLPWSLTKQCVEQELLRDHIAWKKKEKWRCGRISFMLRLAYILFLIIYVAFLVAIIVAIIPFDP